MRDVLAKGRVPAAPFIEALNKYVEKSEGTRQHLLAGVAERCQATSETLETWLDNPARVQTMPFQIADSLLCAINMVDLWHHELRDIYYGVDLNWKKCERDGCNTWFRVGPRINHHIGKRRRRWCSNKCGQMMHKLETGKIKSAKKYNRETHCRNGHKRSIYGTNADGNCKGCVDESNARFRIKHAEKRRAYQREWYAKNKEAKKAYQREWRRQQSERGHEEAA